MENDKRKPSADEVCVLRVLHLLEVKRLAIHSEDVLSPDENDRIVRPFQLQLEHFPITDWPDISSLKPGSTTPENAITIEKLTGTFTIKQPYPLIIVRALVLALAEEPVDSESAFENLRRNNCIRRCESDPWLPRLAACLKMPDGKYLRVGFSLFDEDHDYLEAMATLDGRELFRDGTQYTDLQNRPGGHGQLWFTLPAIELTDFGRMWMDEVVNRKAPGSRRDATIEDVTFAKNDEPSAQSDYSDDWGGAREPKARSYVSVDSQSKMLAENLETPNLNEEKAKDTGIGHEQNAQYCFQQKGQLWHIRYGGVEGSYPNIDGFRYILQLLEEWKVKKPAPAQLSAMTMMKFKYSPPADMVGSSVSLESASENGNRDLNWDGTNDNLLDSVAIADLNKRAKELAEKICEYDEELATDVLKPEERVNMEAKKANKLEELEKIQAQLDSGSQPSGLPRKLGRTNKDRARETVRKAITLAYQKLESGNPPQKNLVKHLKASIPDAKDGCFAYAPTQHIDWQL